MTKAISLKIYLPLKCNLLGPRFSYIINYKSKDLLIEAEAAICVSKYSELRCRVMVLEYFKDSTPPIILLMC